MSLEPAVFPGAPSPACLECSGLPNDRAGNSDSTAAGLTLEEELVSCLKSPDSNSQGQSGLK
jgi:hypothetical protein